MVDGSSFYRCALILMVHFIFLPVPSTASSDLQMRSESSTTLSENYDLPGLSAQKIPKATDISADYIPSQMEDESQQSAGEFVVPEEQSLAGLIGRPEISVLVDVDGQFVTSMAQNRVPEEEPAQILNQTNLSQSISAGRSFNRESRAAAARTKQARAQTGQALALLLPSAFVRASRGYEDSKPSVEVDEITGELISSDTHIRTDVTLTVTQPLFNLPNFLDWRRRKVREKVREESYRVSDGDAYLSTVKTYLSLVSTRLQVDVTRDFEAQLERLLDYIEKRSDAGAASVSDMSRVRARSQATRSSRLEQEASHLAAGTEFVRLTNLVPQKILLPVLGDIGASSLPVSFEEAVPIAMKSNPEIAALTQELKAARMNEAVAAGSFLPRLDAEYTDSYSLHAGGSEDSQRDRRIMLVMNWDLFSGGKDYKRRVENSARYKEVQYLLDDRRRTVVQALAANYATLYTTRERLASGYQELDSIATAAEAMSKRMLSGNQSLLDLLDVYDRYYQARSRLIQLHVLEMNTVTLLIRLTKGTPWPVPQGAPSAAEQSRVSKLSIEPGCGEGGLNRFN